MTVMVVGWRPTAIVWVSERYVPAFKWRAAHFRRLQLGPAAVREGLEMIHKLPDDASRLAAAAPIMQSVKLLMKDLYHVPPAMDEPLSRFAHAIRNEIEDDEVRRHASLD